MLHDEHEPAPSEHPEPVTNASPSRRRVLQAGGLGFGGLLASTLLAACNRDDGSSGGDRKTGGGGGLGDGASDPNETYVMVAYVASNPFWLDLKRGGEDAAKGLGVRFRFTGPNAYDVAAQVSTIKQEVAQKPAGLIVPTSTASAIKPTIDAAAAAGVPVVCVDADAADSKRLCFIGTDHHQLGQVMGQQLVDLTGGNAQVGLSTVPGQDNLDARIAGMKEIFAKNPGMRIVATVNNQGDDSQTASTARAMLQGNPGINAIACVNATTAGIATALRETNKIGSVKAVGSDITTPVIEGIESGALQATLVQRTYMEAYLAVLMLYLHKHPTGYLDVQRKAGIETLPVNINTGTIVVTKDNVAAYKELIKA